MSINYRIKYRVLGVALVVLQIQTPYPSSLTSNYSCRHPPSFPMLMTIVFWVLFRRLVSLLGSSASTPCLFCPFHLKCPSLFSLFTWQELYFFLASSWRPLPLRSLYRSSERSLFSCLSDHIILIQDL